MNEEDFDEDSERDDRDCDHDEDFDRDEIDDDDYSMFADPGGESSLRCATENNPRNQPCRSCGEENVLTPKDVVLKYVCDACARQNEMGF